MSESAPHGASGVPATRRQILQETLLFGGPSLSPQQQQADDGAGAAPATDADLRCGRELGVVVAAVAMNPQLASLFGSTGCHVSRFSSDVTAALAAAADESRGDSLDLQAALLALSNSTADEVLSVNSLFDANVLARDKLAAELGRVTSTLEALERRKRELDATRQCCKVAVNALIRFRASPAATVPAPATSNLAAVPSSGARPAPSSVASAPPANASQQSPASVAPRPMPATPGPSEPAAVAPQLMASATGTAGQGQGAAGALQELRAVLGMFARQNANPELPTGGGAGVQLVSTSSLSAAIVKAISACTTVGAAPWGSEREVDLHFQIIDLMIPHGPGAGRPVFTFSPPSLVVEEAKLLTLIFQRSMGNPPVEIAGPAGLADADQGKQRQPATLDDVIFSAATVSALAGLLGSINDDVKAAALGCLNALASQPAVHQLFFLDATAGALPADGAGASGNSYAALLPPEQRNVAALCHIVATTTHELVLERALVLMWHLVSADERIRTAVRECDGLRSALDLLFTDSMPILENVCVAIGYLTRDDTAKAMLTGGDGRAAAANAVGLEKLVATLYHPHFSIQSKIAAAVWNCAAVDANRTLLRQLGAVPALLGLVRDAAAQLYSAASPYHHARAADGPDDAAAKTAQQLAEVLENSTGALWNLTTEAASRLEVASFGGLPTLFSALRGALVANQYYMDTFIFSAGDGQRANSERLRQAPPVGARNAGRVLENISGVLWNCSSPAESRHVFAKHDGAGLLLELLRRGGQQQLLAEAEEAAGLRPEGDGGGGGGASAGAGAVVTAKARENAAAAIRNCVILDQNKIVVRNAGGIEALLSVSAEAVSFLDGVAAAEGGADGKHRMTLSARQGQVRQWSAAAAALAPILEKSQAALWILTVSAENRHAVRTAGGLTTLASLLALTNPNRAGAGAPPRAVAEAVLPALAREKLVGVLRNCTSEKDNRAPLLRLPTIQSLLGHAAHALEERGRGLTAHLDVTIEGVCGILWNFARDNKEQPRKEGALTFLCRDTILAAALAATPAGTALVSAANASSDPVAFDFAEPVLEQACGALSSLSLDPPNRVIVQQCTGVLELLLRALRSTVLAAGGQRRPGQQSRGASWTSALTAINAVLVVRNCTASPAAAASASASGGDGSAAADEDTFRQTQFRCIASVVAAGGHLTMLSLVREHALHFLSHGGAGGQSTLANLTRETAEQLAKEACLCLKNCIAAPSTALSTSPAASVAARAAVEAVEHGAETILQQILAAAESQETRKAATMALQALQRTTSGAPAGAGNTPSSTPSGGASFYQTGSSSARHNTNVTRF